MKHPYKQWKRQKDRTTQEKFKEDRNVNFRTIRNAKSECWKNYLAEAQGQEIFRALKYTNPRRVQKTPVLQHEGIEYTTFEEKASLFHRTMFPTPPIDQDLLPSNRPRKNIPWMPVTPREVHNAISMSASNKASEPDGIPFLMIKVPCGTIPEIFNSLYINLAREGHQPLCWREATTAVIPKPKKPDYSAPKAYRPVALLNCLGKTLEKIMARRLGYLAERYELLHRDQIAERRQRNADDPVLALTHDVDIAKRP
jgi:hypothetical protein